MDSKSTNSSFLSRISVVLDAVLATGLVLFLIGLPFHLVVKKLIPDPIGTYWKEMLLGGLVVLWAVRCLLARRLWLSGTPLDAAVLVYLGLLVARSALDRSGAVGAWGLYISVLYLPLFWLTPLVLRRWPRQAVWLTAALVAVGALVALGGLAEFTLNTSLWPSTETIQRQGFADVFVYGTHLRRVYFVFDSPTTLANTLALLLPLALALTLLARRLWARAAAGLAAALMAGCLIVTFSRGIWVSVALALAGMILLSLWPRLANLRTLLVVLGGVSAVGAAAGLILALRSGQAAGAEQGVVELAPQAYQAAPVTGVSQDLLQVKPDYGEGIAQTWSLLDPISQHDDVRTVLYMPPPASGKNEVIYRIPVPDAGALRFGIAMSPDVWSPEKGDGVSFQVYVTPLDASQTGRFAFARYINPKQTPADRRWRNYLVDLSPWAGQMVNLSLITDSGPAGNWDYDWAGWSELQVVSLAPSYFASAPAQNPVLQQARSILDWTGDETNRDRLAAWSTALAAWLKAPLWGNGLGSTGAAALRTRPDTAFVTESQVLKALVELGLPGLLALAFLWFQIARVGLRAYRTATSGKRVLLLGLLTALLVIFIEGWVYQNLEVKQVNAYFWVLVGMLAFLAE